MRIKNEGIKHRLLTKNFSYHFVFQKFNPMQMSAPSIAARTQLQTSIGKASSHLQLNSDYFVLICSFDLYEFCFTSHIFKSKIITLIY